MNKSTFANLVGVILILIVLALAVVTLYFGGILQA